MTYKAEQIRAAAEDTGVLIDTCLMPAGTYVLGDPCYSVPQHRWHEWLGVAYENIGATPYKIFDPRAPLVGTLDGYTILGLSTAHGDGIYFDQDNNVYGVDAGLIGLVPVEIADIRHPDVVTEITFDEETVCTRDDDGTLQFGETVIKTGFDSDSPGW